MKKGIRNIYDIYNLKNVHHNNVMLLNSNSDKNSIKSREKSLRKRLRKFKSFFSNIFKNQSNFTHSKKIYECKCVRVYVMHI